LPPCTATEFGVPSHRCSSVLSHRRQPRQRHGNLFRGILVVLQFSRLVVDIRLHIEMPMTAEVEENGALLSFRLGFQRLPDRLCNGVIGFGRGDDPLERAN